MTYLRETTVDILGVDNEINATLLGPPLNSPPQDGEMLGISGYLPTEFTFNEAASFDYRLFDIENRMSSTERDETAKRIRLQIESNYRYRGDVSAEVTGIFYTNGTNMEVPPAVASPIRTTRS